MSLKRIRAFEAKALELAAAGPVSPKDAAAVTDYTVPGARRALRRMADEGKLESLGRRAGGHGRRPEVFGLPGSRAVGPPADRGAPRSPLPPRMRADLDDMTRSELIGIIEELFVVLIGGDPGPRLGGALAAGRPPAAPFGPPAATGPAPKRGRKKTPRKRAGPAATYRLQVSLRGIEPEIWRRFEMPSTATFTDLHRAIQDAFGWEDYHLWEFTTASRARACFAGMGGINEFTGEDVPDGDLTLAGFFGGKIGESCFYVYDFGDDWEHRVRLEAVGPAAPGRRLLDGARAGPPEDCGGVGGYGRFVEFVRTGQDPYGEHPEELREWLGDWDPEAFDLSEEKRRFDR